VKHDVIGFENLHRHSDFSILDGFSTVSEYAERSKEINQKYLCITDHGVMGAIPQQIREADEHNLYPLMGVELYVNPLQPEVNTRKESAEFRANLDEKQKKKFDKSYHLLAIAKTDEGYKNLVRITSWGWIHGFYRKPRVNHAVLEKYKEGIVFSSCCAISETAAAFFEGGDEAGFAVIEKYMAMFGENFFLELMMLDFKLQKPYDAFILRAHEKYGIRLLLSTDCHYCNKEHSHNQRLMLMNGNGRTIQEIQMLIDSGTTDLFELQDSNLWMKSEDELNEKWDSDYRNIIDYELYKQAKANTVKIAEMCKGVELDRSIKLPRFPDANERLKEAIFKGVRERQLPRTATYLSRIQEEFSLICQKEFTSYFLIQKMICDEARKACARILGWGEGWDAVGPGRGCITAE